MNVLLSIKPEYVKEISNGNKRYEFRKTRLKGNVNRAYIYCTSPVKKIVGFFTIGEIIEDAPERLWELYSTVAGIEREPFFAYFENKEEGFAIEIKKVSMFDEPVAPDKLLPKFTPPQSFYYFDDLKLAQVL